MPFKLIPFCLAVFLLGASLPDRSTIQEARVTSAAHATATRPGGAEVSRLLAMCGGNWYDSRSNTWEIGLFPEFVIYRQQFWSYKSATFRNGKWEVGLTNGKKQLALTLQHKTPALLIDMAGSAQLRLDRVKLRLPPYTTVDSSRFFDSRFVRMDTAIITGCLRNVSKERPVTISYTDILANTYISQHANLDKAGRFQVKVPLANTTGVTIAHGDFYYFDVLEPGEHHLVYSDLATRERVVMGDQARLHNELADADVADMDLAAVPLQELPTGYSRADMLAHQKTTYANLKAQFAGLQKSRPLLSRKAVTFINDWIRMGTASTLMQERFQLSTNENLPADLLSYVDSLYNNQPPEPPTVSARLPLFLADQTTYANQFTQRGPDFARIVMIIRKEPSFKFTPEEISALDNFLKVYAEQTPAERSQPLALLNTTGVTAIMTKHQQELNAFLDPVFAQLAFEADLEDTYSRHAAHPQVQRMAVLKLIKGWFEQHPAPMPVNLYETCFSLLRGMPLFEKALADQQESLKTLASDSALLAASQSKWVIEHGAPAAALDSILQPLRGKVVCILFWATWSETSMAQMAGLKKVREMLDNRDDVVFLSFVNRSDEKSWRDAIAQFKINGPGNIHFRLPDEQQGAFERYLKVNSFPAYLLVNREGYFIDRESAIALNGEQLAKAISSIP